MYELVTSFTFIVTAGIAKIRTVISKTTLPTMAVSAPFTEARLMWCLAAARVRRLFYSDTGPLCQAIRNSLRIRVVQLRSAEEVTRLAALKVNSSVVSSPRVLSYRDGNLLACPSSGGARPVTASKRAHNARVVLFENTILIINRKKVEC